jgi:hypothetical protein
MPIIYFEVMNSETPQSVQSGEQLDFSLNKQDSLASLVSESLPASQAQDLARFRYFVKLPAELQILVWRFHLLDHVPPESVIRRVQIHQDAALDGQAGLTFSSPDGVEKTDPYSTICATSRKAVIYSYDARLPGTDGRDIYFDSTRDTILLWKEDNQANTSNSSSSGSHKSSLDPTPIINNLDQSSLQNAFKSIKKLALFDNRIEYPGPGKTRHKRPSSTRRRREFIRHFPDLKRIYFISRPYLSLHTRSKLSTLNFISENSRPVFISLAEFNSLPQENVLPSKKYKYIRTGDYFSLVSIYSLKYWNLHQQAREHLSSWLLTKRGTVAQPPEDSEEYKVLREELESELQSWWHAHLPNAQRSRQIFLREAARWRANA